MTKLNKLLTNWKSGVVYTSSYLSKLGYSPALIAQYKKNNWIVEVGNGAVARNGDSFNWQGGLVAIQKQLNLEVHVGASSALKIQGVTHFLRAEEPVILFGKEKLRLPTWFKSYNWGVEVKYFSTKLFSSDIGLTNHKEDNLVFKISSRERALFEQLYLVPKHDSFIDAGYLFQGLHSLRYELIQKLLEECESIKVKRLFMVKAEELNYPWVRKLDLSRIDFGQGNRLIDSGGTTNSKYKITVNSKVEFL